MRLFLLATALLFACSIAPYKRADYELQKFGDLVVSNSPMVIGRIEPERNEGNLQFTYELVAQNTSIQRSVTLNLAGSEFIFEDKKVSPNCSGIGINTTDTLEIPLNSNVVVHCRVDLAHLVLQSAVTGVLLIPWKNGSSSGRLKLQYLLEPEDFE